MEEAMIVGCYSLDLYCDTPKCPNGPHPHIRAKAEFTAETGAFCRKQARRKGWRLDLKVGKAWCHGCVMDKQHSMPYTST